MSLLLAQTMHTTPLWVPDDSKVTLASMPTTINRSDPMGVFSNVSQGFMPTNAILAYHKANDTLPETTFFWYSTGEEEAVNFYQVRFTLVGSVGSWSVSGALNSWVDIDGSAYISGLKSDFENPGSVTFRMEIRRTSSGTILATRDTTYNVTPQGDL